MPGALPGTAAEPPWASRPTVRPSLVERFGPPALAVLLIAVLTLVGLLNLKYAKVDVLSDDTAVAAIDADADAELVPEGETPPGLLHRSAPPIFEPEEEQPDTEAPVDSDPALDRDRDGPPPPVPAPEGEPLPPGAAAQVEQIVGIALRASRDGENWQWERLEAQSTLQPGLIVVNLPPSRTILDLGSVGVTLVGRADLRVDLPGPDREARFDLIDGDLLLRPSAEGGAVEVGVSGRTLTLDPPPGQPIGLSAAGVRAPGEPAGRPGLTIALSEGSLTASVDGGASETFEGPALIAFDPEAGSFATSAGAEALPAWIDDPEPTEAELADIEAFSGFFSDSSGPLPFVLLEGTMDEEPAIRRLSVAALGAMGSIDPGHLELVAELLNTPDAPELRAEAMTILLRQMARGPEEAAMVHRLLDRVAPAEAVAPMDRLLTGYPEDRQQSPEVLAELVGALSSPNPGVRQLALQTLMTITGRDAQGYDPDSPDEDALESWRSLLSSGDPSPRGRSSPTPKAGDRRR
ncbi:hypothetical protein [Tautonia sociabilis]